MYDVDAQDRVVELDDVPPGCTGAPLPIVVADEGTLQLAYLASEREPGGEIGTDERAVLVQFDAPYAWFHGPPNDEAFEGHPLAARGLHPYGAFRIEASSWLRRLERMNAVHEHHQAETFARLTHYVFAFHDSTFEWVAQSFTAAAVDKPLATVAQEMVRALGPW